MLDDDLTLEEAQEKMDQALVVLWAVEKEARDLQEALSAAREEVRQARRAIRKAEGH